MSFHLSAISIPVDCHENVPGLFADQGYTVHGKTDVKSADQLNTVMDEIERSPRRLAKATLIYHGATHILDPELVMWNDEKSLKHFSKQHACRVFAWLAVFDPETYGFNLFEGGKWVRSVLLAGGELTQSGIRIPEEKDLSWKSLNETAFESFVTQMKSVFYLPNSGAKICAWSLSE